MTRRMNAYIAGRFDMSKELTFYKLKYCQWPTFKDMETLYTSEYGRYVLNEWAAAIVTDICPDTNSMIGGLEVLNSSRIQENFVWEFDDLLNDIKNDYNTSQRKQIYLNAFHELLAMVDEIEYE